MVKTVHSIDKHESSVQLVQVPNRHFQLNWSLNPILIMVKR